MNIGRICNKSKSFQRSTFRHMLSSSCQFGGTANPNHPLETLEIIGPQTSPDRQTHLRLIQELSQSKTNQGFISIKRVSNVLHQLLESSNLNDPDSDSDTDSPRFIFDAVSFSSGISSCSSLRDLRGGTQYHCLAFTSGFLANAYVGSSLITLYVKCGKLENAYKLFDEMPVRNLVTWTAIISGFAQECQVDICLELFSVMRNSTLKPNDFTFTSLLSSCTGVGALGQGRSAHCLIVRMGFHSYLHIANALISMYSKCGNVQDALYIFKNMNDKDIVTWNSMITGYAHHGLALEALELFEKMKRLRIKPDPITYLGVLSSCRHSGFVERGKNCFSSMAEYGVRPELDHYSCLVDLLGRAGFIEEALNVIFKMPISPNAVIWGSLLSSCRLHGNLWIGIQAAESRLLLKPDCAVTHVQLANLYASVGCWDKAARVRKLMKDGAAKTNVGFSWIEIKNKVYTFRAEDSSNTRIGEIVAVVDYLADHMTTLGYTHQVRTEEEAAFAFQEF